MILKYYLDTNAVQSLGCKLCEISSKKGVYTSILSIMELVKSIKDEDSFRRKRGALLHLRQSSVLLDMLHPTYVFNRAFKIDYEIHPIYWSFNRIVDVALESDDYRVFMDSLDKNDLIESFEGLKIIFKKSNEYFIKNLSLYNETGNVADNKRSFEERWKGKENRRQRLYESINHYTKKQSKRQSLPFDELLANYDHSLDIIMLTSCYYDEKKNYRKELAANNDGFDLQHLMYLREGCKLVTDDSTFKTYVNEVFNGLAIGTEQFLKEATT